MRSFAKGETDEGLDLLQPITVEGKLVVNVYPARGQFPKSSRFRSEKSGG